MDYTESYVKEVITHNESIIEDAKATEREVWLATLRIERAKQQRGKAPHEMSFHIPVRDSDPVGMTLKELDEAEEIRRQNAFDWRAEKARRRRVSAEGRGGYTAHGPGGPGGVWEEW